MPALHEGNTSERPHDVVFYRRERTKPDRAVGVESRCLDVQDNAFFSKPIPGNADLIVFLVKIRVRWTFCPCSRLACLFVTHHCTIDNFYGRKTHMWIDKNKLFW